MLTMSICDTYRQQQLNKMPSPLRYSNNRHTIAFKLHLSNQEEGWALCDRVMRFFILIEGKTVLTEIGDKTPTKWNQDFCLFNEIRAMEKLLNLDRYSGSKFSWWWYLLLNPVISVCTHLLCLSFTLLNRNLLQLQVIEVQYQHLGTEAMSHADRKAMSF